jgi:hypothetical protein
MDQLRREHFQHKEKQNLGQDFNLTTGSTSKLFPFMLLKANSDLL